MTAPLFPDTEQLLVKWLSAQVQARVCTELDFGFTVPVVHLERISGAERDYVLDAPIVDVDTYEATRGKAFLLARSVHALLHSTLPGLPLPGALVTSCRTVVGPRWLPYDDTTKRRVSASYQLSIRTA